MNKKTYYLLAISISIIVAFGVLLYFVFIPSRGNIGKKDNTPFITVYKYQYANEFNDYFYRFEKIPEENLSVNESLTATYTIACQAANCSGLDVRYDYTIYNDNGRNYVYNLVTKEIVFDIEQKYDLELWNGFDNPSTPEMKIIGLGIWNQDTGECSYYDLQTKKITIEQGLYDYFVTLPWQTEYINGKSAIVLKNEKTGLVELSTGVELIPTENDQLYCNLNYCAVWKNNKVKLFDLQSHQYLLNDKAYDDLWFGNQAAFLQLDYFPVLLDQKYLIVDRFGNQVIKLADANTYNNGWFYFNYTLMDDQEEPSDNLVDIYLALQVGPEQFSSDEEGAEAIGYPVKYYIFLLETKKIIVEDGFFIPY